NKRRRQTIIVAITMGMILFCQLPNLINMWRPWEEMRPFDQDAGQPGQPPETKEQAQGRERDREVAIERAVYLANVVLPPGWLAMGAMGLAEGDVLPALLGTLGMGLIGSA